ncbi:hypothetical protein [Methanoregula sp.]|uniref:hypothetical protein n=1 Tax=Methanoregula sp. TaxID=2052170 RepID=UPI003BB1BAFC
MPVKNPILEVTGNSAKIDALERLLRHYGVKELVRTGRIALPRDTKHEGIDQAYR